MNIHEQLHAQKVDSVIPTQNSVANYSIIPQEVINTLDEMAYALSTKENINISDMKQKLVANINNLPMDKLEIFVNNILILIDKSVNSPEGESIKDDDVDKSFISFLIQLFY